MKEFQIISPKYGTFTVKVDDEDFYLYEKYTWHICKCSNLFYASRREYLYKKKTKRGRKVYTRVYLHREILGLKRGGVTHVDHIDSNTTNNQKNNLRLVNQRQNCWNSRKKKNNTSGYKGVSFDKRRDTFYARIRVNYKRIHAGNFKTAKAAAIKYNELAIKHHGEFARLNIIL